MKTAEEWQRQYANEVLSRKLNRLSWNDGSLLRAIQIDALQHVLNLVQYSDPVATVNAIGAEIQKLKETK